MVTRIADTNTKHCVCETINRLLVGADPMTASLLKRLYNAEVYVYGTSAFRSGSLSISTIEGFFVRYGFGRYLLLIVLASLPPVAVVGLKHARGALRRIRARDPGRPFD